MSQKIQMILKQKNGFTLMEMLIAVAIIAILLAILIPSFGGALNRAKVSADQANARAWYTELMTEMMVETTDRTSDPTKPASIKLQAPGAKLEATGKNAATLVVTYTTTVEGGSITFSSKDGSST